MEISVETALLNLMKNPSYFAGLIPVNTYTLAWTASMTNNSNALQALVPANSISNVWPHTLTTLPWIALFQTSGDSKARLGYSAGYKVRERHITWQVSVFSKTKDQGREISAILDPLMTGGVPGIIYGVEQTNDPDQYDITPDRWHFPLRYSGSYEIQDS